ncbi:MAG: hypothetical protein GF330_00030 [Candidatus Eisenbacteria bacterium]|nr:hypothetical protein [Candidatus Eisenbacteria bacterium]
MRAPIVLLGLLLAIGAQGADAQLTLMINEVYYDAPGTDTGMFVELIGPPGLVLDDFQLVGVDGQDGIEYRTILLSGMVIPDDGHLVIGQDASVPNVDYISLHANLENGPDAVELRYFLGPRDYELVDGVCYGYSAFLDCEGGTHADDVPSGSSIARCPNGQDTDDNAADFIEAVPSPGEPNDCPNTDPTWMPLCEAVTLDENGVPVHLGEWVHIMEPLLILNDDGTYSTDHLDHAATDGECCVYLFDFDYDPGLMAGDQVDVIGTIDFYNGKVEIAGPDISITVLSSGHPLPDPQLVTTAELASNGNDYESCLIQLCGLTMVGGDPWPDEGDNANIEVMDETGVVVTLRIDRDTDVDGSAPPAEPFSMCGIAGQYDTSEPYFSDYQILPRHLEDVNCGGPSPARDGSWGELKHIFR